jgi:hypothetical protein
MPWLPLPIFSIALWLWSSWNFRHFIFNSWMFPFVTVSLRHVVTSDPPVLYKPHSSHFYSWDFCLSWCAQWSSTRCVWSGVVADFRVSAIRLHWPHCHGVGPHQHQSYALHSHLIDLILFITWLFSFAFVLWW